MNVKKMTGADDTVVICQFIIQYHRYTKMGKSCYLLQTRNTVSNAHKMIPAASPCFLWQSPCFALGHPKIMRIKI